MDHTTYKIWKTTRSIISCVRSAFLDLPSSGTVNAKDLKSEGCLSTKTVEQLCDKNTQNKKPNAFKVNFT